MAENENRPSEEEVTENSEEQKGTTSSENNNAPEPPKKPLSDLPQRLLTAVFIGALYALGVIGGLLIPEPVGPYFYDALIIFLMLFASYEFSRAISINYAKPINFFVYANIIVVYITFKIVDDTYGSGGITSYFGVLAVVFISCIVFNMFSSKYNINNVISTLFVLIYPGAITTYTLALNYLGNYTPVAIGILFVSTILTDSLAYFVGSIVKGPKLCPKISPKKTVSGAIGGTLGGTIGGVIIYFFAEAGWLTMQPITTAFVPNLLHFIFLGLGTAITCQIGDLISSYIKRACQIKDFGSVLKGHGGFMDRIDGIIISAVFIFIYFTIMNMGLIW